MKNFIFGFLLFLIAGHFQNITAQEITNDSIYFPPAGTEWLERLPESVGMNSEFIKQAINLAVNNENSVEKDLRIAILKGFSHEPYHELAGPVRERGGPAGLVIKDGFIVAKWGDIERVDMTFSVTKSFLSAIAGIAYDEGLIQSVDDPVRYYVWDRTFDGEHNSTITWHHLLNQSSDWYGTLFGMEDWADRPVRDGDIDSWRTRELHTPGTHYKYNDVRVNLLAYSLMHVLRHPLPQILSSKIMNPIGASSTWRWFGYDNSWIELDGLKMQSVTGGGHSGGGLFINTLDQARFGLLYARNGKWKSDQIVSKEWIELSKIPKGPNQEYGYLWWTLKGDTSWEGVPNHLYYAAGFGGNFIIVDELNDLVIVTRWLDNAVLGKFVGTIYKSIQ